MAENKNDFSARARREKKRDSAANGAPAEPQTPPATPEPCDEPPTPPASPEPCDEPPPPPDSPEPRDESYDSTAYEAYASTYDAPPEPSPEPAPEPPAPPPSPPEPSPPASPEAPSPSPPSSPSSPPAPSPPRAWAVGVEFGLAATRVEQREDAAVEPRATCFVAETADGRTLFGCSYMRSELAAAAARGAEQRAVAVVSVFPAYDLLEERVLALSVLALDEAHEAKKARAVAAAAGRDAAARRSRRWRRRPSTRPGALDGKPSDRGYLVGTCNAMVALRLGAAADAVADVDACTVTWGKTPVAAAARALDARAKQLEATLACWVDGDGAGAPVCRFVGGDDWARAEIRTWAVAALGDAAAPSFLSKFRGPDFGELLLRRRPRVPEETASAEQLEESSDGGGAPEPLEESQLEESYEGGRDARGRRDGYGTCASHRYNYVGDWRADAAHGRGSLATATFVYTGAFVEGVFHGSGEWKALPPAARRTYDGEFARGEFHGAGRLDCAAEGCPRPDARGAWISYVGEFERGLRHGVGACTYASGAIYSGEWAANEATGEGALVDVDGSTIRGNFRAGAADGSATWRTREGDELDGFFVQGAPDWAARWTVRYADGRRYSGALRDGVPSGAAGMMRYADGAVYEGCFADGLRSGRGVLHGADGATVAGEWRCDLLVRDAERAARPEKPAGFVGSDDDAGFCSTSDDDERRAAALTGHTFDGDWKRGLRHGSGTFTSGDGAFSYCGQWRLGRRCGEGTATLRGKVSYAGRWRDDAFHGDGALTYADGAVYKGEWFRGERHGVGHLVKRDGETFAGSWVAGRPHGEGTLTRPDGTSHAGGFVRGAPHGWGVVTTASEERECAFVDGVAVEDDVKITYGAGGHWVRGKRAGKGVGVFANGDSYDGEWQNDHPALVGGGTLKSASGATRVFER
ncbi:hypothetical protein JL722_5857 [Aureococcus anophagefferens]|nr:hypothetical protein JL722_5857 [Aureococcus anophagefferens]